MKFSHIALTLVLMQWLVIGIGYFVPSLALLYYLLIDTPPLYLIVLLVQGTQSFPGATAYFLGVLGFHVVKYFMFARIKMGDEEVTFSTIAAIILEIAYLGITSYLFYRQLMQ